LNPKKWPLIKAKNTISVPVANQKTSCFAIVRIFKSKAFNAEETGDAYLCQYKNSNNSPFFDANHKQFNAEQVGKE
jgi:CDGSH-type Zn-finger protein